MLKWRCRILACGVLLALLILILLTAAQYYLQTPSMKGLIKDAISKSIHGKLSWEDLRISFLGRSIEIREAKLFDPDGNPLAGIKKLYARISLSGLIKRNLVVSELDIQGPWVNLETDTHGRVILAKVFAGNAGKPGPKTNASFISGIFLDKLILSNGRFVFRTHDNNYKIVAQNITVNGSGALNTLQANAQLMMGPVDLSLGNKTMRFDSLALNASANPEAIDIAVLRIVTANSRIGLNGQITGLPENPGGQIVLEGNIDLKELGEFQADKTDLNGITTFKAEVSGNLSNPDANIRLDCKNLSINSRAIGNLALVSRLNNLTLEIERLMLVAPDYQAAVNGRIRAREMFPSGLGKEPVSVDQLSYSLGLKGSVPDIGALLSLENVTGSCGASVTLSGKGVIPGRARATLLMEGEAHRFGPRKGRAVNGRMHAEGFLDHGRVLLRSCSGTLGQSILTAQGQMEYATKRTRGFVCVDSLNLAWVLPFMGLKTGSGIAKVSASLTGMLPMPNAICTLTARGLSIDSHTVGDINADISMDASGLISMTRFMLENRKSRLELNGSVALRDPLTRQFSNDPVISLNCGPNTLFLEDFSDNMQGEIHLLANANGKLSMPVGTITLKSSSLNINAKPVPQLNLVANLEGQRLTLAPFDIVFAKDQAIHTEGWINRQGDYDFSASSGRISIGSIKALPGSDSISGTLGLRLLGSGSIKNPSLSGTVLIDGFSIKGNRLDTTLLTFSLADKVIKFNCQSNFSVQGTYQVKKNDFDLAATFKETDLSAYFAFAGLHSLKSKISGQVSASGNLAFPLDIEGKIDFPVLEVTYDSLPLITSHAFKATLSHQRLQIPDVYLALLEHGRLKLTGSADINGPLNLQIDGDIPLKTIGAFVQDLGDLSGRAAIHGRLTGTQKQPVVAADADISGFSMQLPGTQQELRNVNGRILLSGNAITVENINGNLDDGSFSIKGDILLDHSTPKRISATFSGRNLPIQVPDVFDLLLNADLMADTGPDSGKVSGNISILEGLYFKDVPLNPLPGLWTHQRAKPAADKISGTPFFKNLKLDVALKPQGSLLINNNLANMSIRPDMQLSGTSGNPILTGRMDVLSGTIQYQDRIFTITRGTLTFKNPYQTVLDAEIEANITIRDWEILLTISGEPDSLKITLKTSPSSPTLPEGDADILALLIFEKTMAELRDKQAASTTSSEQFLMGLLESSAGKEIKGRIGLDVFAVGPGTGPGSTTVMVGKTFSRRLASTYAVESEAGNFVQRAAIEYRLSESLQLKLIQEIPGNYGGEIQMQFEFR
ncbi:MAG: translocation/assembly module TamB domain-containing protein [Fibrobacterota bacterium]